MARKPAHLERDGAMTPRDRIWAAIRRHKRVNAYQLKLETDVVAGTIHTYLKGLEKAGYIRRDGVARHPYNNSAMPEFVLERDVGVDAPRVTRDGRQVKQGAGREQMWRTMKIIGEFSVADLIAHASTEECPVKLSEAKTYISFISRAGYLAITSRSKPGTPARYRFLKSKNTGPRPPQVQRSKEVFDPNLGEVVWRKGAEEVA